MKGEQHVLLEIQSLLGTDTHYLYLKYSAFLATGSEK
jgi:hypothetical protein